ncbi:TPA: peptidase T [Streptococcus agalactiae]
MSYEKLLERFLTYVKINTRSNPNSTQTPTTQSQVDFALTVLKPEMEAIGLKDVHYLPSNGYLVGTLPATSDRLCHKIGFISHMDTADFNAENITPQIVDYKGGDIELGDSGYILSPKDFPNLNNYHGQTLITTDGKTLLGADDKSGIAEIMTAMEYLASHPEIEHCEIRVGFGPDEEIGIGADKFDVKDFDVDFAYEGRNVHPGTAKNQMINALQLAMDFHSQLPENERPEQTDGYQGFYHLYDLSGTVDQAKSSYIIRDFEEVNFLKRKHLAQDIADNMNEALQSERVKVKLYDQYYNMKKVIEKDMTPINIAKEVMEELDIKPIIEPIRGGTDGSKISFMGIPTPNLFAGGENMHGRFEFVSLQTMEKAVDVILGIVAKD